MKKVGIIGGMGPEATLDLFQKIIAMTPAKSDQAHLPILIDHNPQIPDRTTYLLRGGENPLPHLVSSARQLEKNGAKAMCMPCNTAHYFIDKIRPEIQVPFISIIESTYYTIKKDHPELTKIGLLATSGTIATRIYHTVFEQGGLQIIMPAEQDQHEIMRIIYSVKGGELTNQRASFLNQLEKLAQNGAEAIIAGCTELPLLLESVVSPVPVFDPTHILAQEVVSFSLKNGDH